MLADLSRKKSIQALAAAIPRPLGLLINNAATAVRRRRETAEGIELQFGHQCAGLLLDDTGMRRPTKRGASGPGGQCGELLGGWSGYGRS